MNADGSGQRNLTRHRGADDFAAWSPDGRQIAFVRSGEIYVMLDRLEVTLNVIAPSGKVIPLLIVDRPRGEFLDVFGNLVPIHLVITLAHRDPEQGRTEIPSADAHQGGQVRLGPRGADFCEIACDRGRVELLDASFVHEGVVERADLALVE